MKKIMLLLLLCSLALAPSIQALSWAYSFVVWKGNVYEVTKETVPESEIGKVIGEVKTKPNEMTGNHYGNASNYYPKGTKYYEIKGISTKAAIAVEEAENEWVKAVFVRKAPFHWMDIFTKGLPVLVMAAIVIFLFYKLKSIMTQKKDPK